MLLPTREMGCGRSKHHSRENSTTNMGSDPKSKRSKMAKEKKKNFEKKNQQDVTIDRPVATVGSKRGQEVESGVLKTRRPTPAHNGTLMQTGQTDIKVVVNEDKAIPNEMPRGNIGTKEKTGDGQNQYIRVTNSQIEFFKMLDEKIEQGRDYPSEDDLSQPGDHANTDNFKNLTQ